MHELVQLAAHFHAQTAGPSVPPTYAPTPGPTTAPIDPGPIAPPGVAQQVSTIIGWVHWGAYAAGILAFLLAGTTMMIGKRNRSSMAADGASHLTWVVAGLLVVSASSLIVGALIG